ncbi:MAG: hypothetical protein AAGG68_04895 [Bacteroidota bacterium]
MLEEVRLFRNRVAHNEPLCFKSGAFSLDRVEKVYNYIGILFQLLNRDLHDLSKIVFAIHRNLLEVSDFLSDLPEIISQEKN